MPNREEQYTLKVNPAKLQPPRSPPPHPKKLRLQKVKKNNQIFFKF